MSDMNELARKASLTAACLLTLTGMGLSIAAILFPSWQVQLIILFRFDNLPNYSTAQESYKRETMHNQGHSKVEMQMIRVNE